MATEVGTNPAIFNMISNFSALNVTSDEEWDIFVKNSVGVDYFPPNNRLKVYGTNNLWVGDASIIPLTVGAIIQQSVYAAAEKAPDMIIVDLNLS
ncbi:hypothetical protein K435DRAFT_856615 [Dendrothele bispora CBS 962.96]|uniref:Glucose-methanol-choline oxidoreductase C-terminal domain-containing protein n=1 Tax=Dendrothele bispora (strain CBS 962.96) TaxID=1314807 RepID=A0A4S8M8H8_DENBC|nr:hypothetical protein K435DRAFT_856615 [Dendrothele bispora CBS 962.96]